MRTIGCLHYNGAYAGDTKHRELQGVVSNSHRGIIRASTRSKIKMILVSAVVT